MINSSIKKTIAIIPARGGSKGIPLKNLVRLDGKPLLDYTVNGRPYRREGRPPGNRSRKPRVAHHNTYKCIGDDRWCVISIFNEAEWGNFCNTINRKDLLNN